MSPECTADIGRIVATLISVIELKTFVGKYRPLKLVFSSSSLGITLLLNSGHCFRDYVSWKYLSWRVSRPVLPDSRGWQWLREKSKPLMSVFLHRHLLLRRACVSHAVPTPSRNILSCRPAHPQVPLSWVMRTPRLSRPQVCSRSRILHASSSESLHNSVDS